MSTILEPPSFVSEKKSFGEYKKDLLRWSRLTSLDKKVQAEMVVYSLEGHPSRIKEKITTQLSDELENNEDGIAKLLEFLAKIYEKDSMADAWDRYTAFESFEKKEGVEMSEFVADWENEYYKMEVAGCKYPDIILAFKVLKASRLNELDTKLVLTGVDYEKGKENGTLLLQMKESLKKFKGRGVLGAAEEPKAVSTYLTAEVEQVLITKGWRPPPKRRRSPSPTGKVENHTRNPNYKGKKNPLGSDGLPIKCYRCKCDCKERCGCQCVYHLANKCPGTGVKVAKKVEKVDQADEKARQDLGLFMKANLPQGSGIEATMFTEVIESAEVVLVANTIEECLISKEEHQVLIDSACPTTVAGVEWIKSFISKLNEEEKKLVKVRKSARVYKFGGGEKRKSLCEIEFPCHIAKTNVHMRTEVVEADLPLLLGNSTLKSTGAKMCFKESKIELLGEMVNMEETGSGNYSIPISATRPDAKFKYKLFPATNKVVQCLICDEKGLAYEEVVKLHHYYGHVSVNKLEQLVRNSER